MGTSIILQKEDYEHQCSCPKPMIMSPAYSAALSMAIFSPRAMSLIDREGSVNKSPHFNFTEIRGEAYIPNYTRDDLTDALDDKFGFRTDCEIVTKKDMKRIIKATRK